jgi:hypothetical protein
MPQGGSSRIKCLQNLSFTHWSSVDLSFEGLRYLACGMKPKKFLAKILAYSPDLPPTLDLEKLRFTHNGKSGWNDSNDLNGNFRAEIVELLFENYEAQHHALIRFLLEAEIAYCSSESTSTETLRQLTFMAFVLGEMEDIPLLYQAKFATSFDASIGLDWELILGKDKEAVRAYFTQNPHARYDIVAAIAESDEYELRTPEEFEQGMREYFGVAD